MAEQSKKGMSPIIVLVAILAVAAAGFAFTTYRQSRVAGGETEKLKQELADAKKTADEKSKEAAEAKSDAEAKAKEAEEAKKAADEAAKEAEAAKLAALAAPEEWASSTIKALGVSFRYPKEWGTTKTSETKGDKGTFVTVTFSKISSGQLFLSTHSPDYFLEGSEPLPTVVAKCDGLAAALSKDGKKVSEADLMCTEFSKDDHAVITYAFPDGVDMWGPRNNGTFATGKNAYPTLEIFAFKPSGVSLDTLKKILYSIK